VIPRLRHDRHVVYVIVGFLLTIGGTVVLVLAPTRGLIAVICATIVEAAGAAILAPYGEGFVTAVVDPAERARILSVINTVVLAVSSPFGWIAGILSESGKSLPFVLIIGLLTLSVLFLLVRNPERRR
jgi:drug/metabolite transporter (DMT)-like permease